MTALFTSQRPLTCVNCGSAANQDQIISNKRLSRGSRCNKCLSDIQRAKRKQDPVSTKLSNMYSAAKRRALQRGLEFDLTLDHLRSLFVWHCPALGIRLDWGLKGSGNVSTNSPSLDRIDSNKGYTKSNTVIISRRANTIKNDANAKELLLIGEWLQITTTAKAKERLLKGKTKERPLKEKARLSDLQKKQIARLNQEGMTYRQIAETVKCSKSTVGYILKKKALSR